MEHFSPGAGTFLDDEGIKLSFASPVAEPLGTRQSNGGRNFAILLVIVLLAGFALRIGSALLLPNVHYPDELFQTLEPAHRLAFGPSIVTWEFHVGLRSMVLPAIFAGIMRATAWLGPGSAGYLVAIKTVLCLLSLTVIFVAYRIGQYTFDSRVGVFCAGICAFWHELIYFSPRALSEVIAAHLLLPAIYLAAFTSPAKEAPAQDVHIFRIGKRHLFFAGLFCGAALMLRVQLAPAVAVLIIYSCRMDWRNKWVPMIAGMMPPVLLFGIVDWITWSYPFQSTYLNFAINLVQHKAAQFGSQPFNFYIRKWLTFLGPMILFSVVGAVTVRRARVLGYMVLAILIPHSLLAHKEVRFLYPALPLMLILAGLGIWQCATWLKEHTRCKWVWATALAMLALAGGTTSALDARKVRWHNHGGTLRAMQHLSKTPDACGVALRGVDWGDSGGYAYLHRDIPIFVTTVENAYIAISPADEKTIERWMSFNLTAPAFNYVVAEDRLPLSRFEYKRVRCWGDACLYKRSGPCAAVPNYSTSELLRLMNK